MTKKSEFHSENDGRLTSAGIPLSEVADDVRHEVEWMDGVHGSALDQLPSIDVVPIPEVLTRLPRLHPDRPRGATAMIDAHGENHRLKNCRPGAWLISPRTSHKWAKWPDDSIGWLPKDTDMPSCLRVSNRNDEQ